MKIPKHPMSFIGLNYIGLNFVTHNGITSRISTISYESMGLYETAVDLTPVEKYPSLSKAIIGHEKYIELMKMSYMKSG